MRSKDVQDIVLPKNRGKDSPTKIFRNLNGAVDSATINSCCQMIRQFRSIELSSPSRRPQIVRINENIREVKNHSARQGPVSIR